MVHRSIKDVDQVQLICISPRRRSGFGAQKEIMAKQHHYALTIEWTGNTGEGTRSYQTYERSHRISAGNKPAILASSDPAFRGDKTWYNPEELLVAALSIVILIVPEDTTISESKQCITNNSTQQRQPQNLPSVSVELYHLESYHKIRSLNESCMRWIVPTGACIARHAS